MITTDQSTFRVPTFLSDVHSWHGHIAFAQVIIHRMKPRVVVELGVHKGDSFLAFFDGIKSVQDLDPDYEPFLYGVDTWCGDQHAGYYSAEGESYKQNIQQLVGSSGVLIQKTFDDAASMFSEGVLREIVPINLLHIDGYHTYEAVRHDFETWQPLMARDGVILFHDSQEVGNEFGVGKFMKDLKDKGHGYFEFTHSHGLAVVSANPGILNGNLLDLFMANIEERDAYGRYLESLSQRLKEDYQRGLLPKSGVEI